MGLPSYDRTRQGLRYQYDPGDYKTGRRLRNRVCGTQRRFCGSAIGGGGQGKSPAQSKALHGFCGGATASLRKAVAESEDPL
jgi:hypothetical protein